MFSHGLLQVPGLQQLFIRRDKEGCVDLAIAKVVDDFLISGTNAAIHSFHDAISERLTVGRFITGQSLIFNRLHISQQDSFSVHFNMREYIQTIRPLDIPRHRRKDQNSKCTKKKFPASWG